MSADTPVPTRATVRVPFQAEVVVEFDRFSGFLAETSANLSLGGMFLTTRYLKPVGSELQFEVRLKDAAPLIRGRGIVAWTRWQDQGPRRPAGMGVRFMELDAESRELVYKIVDERLRSGQVGEELALDAEALRATEALPDLGPLPPLAPPETPIEESRPTAPPLSANPAPETLPASLPVIPPTAPPAPPSFAPRPPEPALPQAPARLDAPAVPAALPPRPAAVSTPPRDAPPLADIVARAAASWVPEPPAAPAQPFMPATPPKAFTSTPPPRPRPRRTPWIPIALAAVVVLVIASGWWWAQRSSDNGSVSQEVATARPAPAANQGAPSSSGNQPPAVSIPQPPAAAPDAGPSAPAPAISAAPSDTPASTAVAPPPSATLPHFTKLERVTWVEGSGTTDLVLWLDGSIPEGSFQRTRIEGREPRELVKLRGVKEPFVPGRVEVGTPEVRRVRTGFHAGGANSELHVVLDLAAGARVEATRVEGQALHLMVAFR